MKIFKTYTQLILENVPTGINIGDPAIKATKKDDTKKDDTVIPPAKVVAPTAPDPAIMAKLLKIPNSRGNTMFNTNETKPTENNGVAVSISGTGRNYNFRSAPLNVVVYIDNPQTENNIAYTGTYTISDTEIITKSSDGKISETITISTGRLAIDPTTKQPKSNLPSSEGVEQKQKGVAQTVAAAINANSGNFSDSNEDVVYNAIEAAFYWIIKNKLSPDQAREFLKIAFAKAEQTVYSMDIHSFAGLFQYFESGPASTILNALNNWKIVWKSESDESNAYLASKVPANTALSSYEPAGDEAKKWAETVWNIIDDSWVSVDEEINAILAILALTPKGLINVDAGWKDLQTLGIIDSSLGIDAAIAYEVDSSDSGTLVKRLAAALRGTPSEGAKKMLELS